ncbi:ANTAR domain-containing protein [Rhodococcoides fascians]|uniref:ANTAR domain-containing protein n=1 Tax=Rhodococcoides fascians TaxID=1828 RepID=UPI00050CDB72|nr:ANTAR domain-containing protein [Rhodococcus fascians]
MSRHFAHPTAYSASLGPTSTSAVGVLAERLHVSLDEATARLRARAYADARSISSLAFDIVRGDGLFYDDPGSA